MRDVKQLTLTPNSAPRTSSPGNDDADLPHFICPLNLKEMNGVQPFVYISTCGCVFSQAGLKTVLDTSKLDSGKGKEKADEEEKDAGKQMDLCPQCQAKFDGSTDIILLNPGPEDEARMRTAMELRRLSEPAKPKKKRKAANPDSGEPPAKKVAVAPNTNPSIAAASRSVLSSLAMEEAKRKAGMSDAVKSLYADPNAPKRKETFMTMNTFTRVSRGHSKCSPLCSRLSAQYA